MHFFKKINFFSYTTKLLLPASLPQIPSAAGAVNAAPLLTAFQASRSCVSSQTPPQLFLHNGCCPIFCMNHLGRNRAIICYFKGWILLSHRNLQGEDGAAPQELRVEELMLKMLSGRGDCLLPFKCLFEPTSQLNSSKHI